MKMQTIRRRSTFIEPLESRQLLTALGVNLLLNPGADAAAGATDFGTAVATPNWTTSGKATAVKYGIAGGLLATDPGPASRGANYFAGGPDTGASTATFTQSINVSDLASTIDANGMGGSVAGYFGGFSSQEDFAALKIRFLSSTSTELGSTTIGNVTVVNRNSVTGLLSRSATINVPTGTRSIQAVLTMTRINGSYNDGYADALSLILQAKSPAPEAEVRGNNVIITDGDTTPSATDFTDFGTVKVGVPLTRTFTVKNLGTAALTTSALSVPAGFSIDGTDTLLSSIPAGGQDTFKVKLNATAAGTFSGNISFNNNDSNENPYNFAIKGVVTTSTPEAAVLGNNVEILDGDITPSTTDFTDFGTANFNGPITRTFTVKNTGTGALTTSGLTVPAGFSIDASDTLLASIPAGGSDTFKVKLNATSAGTFTGNISFANNDANENPYNFAVKGIVNQPFAVLASGVLTVKGTSGADQIRGSVSGANFVFRLNSLPAISFSAAAITSIVVNAGAGNDYVALDFNIKKNTTLNGEDGDDFLVGGGLKNTYNGGIGNDVAIRRVAADIFNSVEEILA